MKSGKIGVCLLVDTVGVDAGTERLVTEIANRLNSDRFDVHLCCLADSERFRAVSSCCHAKLFPFARFYGPSGWKEIARFRRYLKSQQVDIVHAFMFRTALLGVTAGYSAGCKVVTTRMSMEWYTPYVKAIFRFYMNPRTTRVMANADAVKRVASRMESLAPEQIDVMRQGVDIRRFTPYAENSLICPSASALGIPKGAPVVGIVANYRPVKDLPLFIRAARTVADHVPHATFLLVGDGPLRAELVDLAKELGLAKSVFFTNGTGDVRDHLASMSVACLSSFSEGFSNAILEYMACGLPVVATDVGGNGEAVLHGEAGYLVRERTPDAFAAPIITLLQNEDLRRKMASKSLNRVRQLFSMDSFISRLERYYQQLASGRVPDAEAEMNGDEAATSLSL